MTRAAITGIVLAAGAGTRMGMPKALKKTSEDEPWVARSVKLLRKVGCEPVLVVLGARASDAQELVPDDAKVKIVVAEKWADGMSESLTAGLEAAAGRAALIALVDMPDLPLDVVKRVFGGKGSDLPEPSERTLRQAVYNGRPGHPVLIGRAHWKAVVRELAGDTGARAYLVDHDVEEIECGDLYDGHDQDFPE